RRAPLVARRPEIVPRLRAPHARTSEIAGDARFVPHGTYRKGVALGGIEGENRSVSREAQLDIARRLALHLDRLVHDAHRLIAAAIAVEVRLARFQHVDVEVFLI